MTRPVLSKSDRRLILLAAIIEFAMLAAIAVILIARYRAR